MFKTLVPFAAALLASPVTAAAPAAAPIVERDGVHSVRIDFFDLEIATLAGEAALRERVDAAIDRLCNEPLPIEYTRSWPPRSHESCETLTAEVTEPQLLRLFERRGKVEVTALTVSLRFAAR